MRRKLEENKIPKGCYCHENFITCPFYSYIMDENISIVYCRFLKQGDVSQINNEEFEILIKKYGSEDEVNKKYPLVFLWDMCKECGINDEIDEEYT